MTLKPVRNTDADEAVARARGEVRDTRNGSTPWQRMCLKFVRTCWGLPARYPTAQDAWDNAVKKHRWTGDTNDIPFGAPVFSQRPNAGPDDAGHVFICGAHGARGRRLFRSTDIAVTGGVSTVNIDAFTEKWGHRILGWTGDLNGYELPLPPSPNERRKRHSQPAPRPRKRAAKKATKKAGRK